MSQQTVTKTREEKMSEEDQIFKVINTGCKGILKIMAGDCVIASITPKKQQILPNNYTNIIEHCKKVLPANKLRMVMDCKRMIDTCIKIIIERYMEWGLAMGENIGRSLGVDPIESKSCAIYALYRAAFTYEPGNGFANYAPFWIKQVIQKSIDDRMLSTLDNPLGEDMDGETSKDRVPSDPHYEPSNIVETEQLSDVFRYLLHQIPVQERPEVLNWWEMDAEVTPVVKRFAHRMSEMI